MHPPLPCQSESECGEREECLPEGTCGCMSYYGFANPPACDEFTTGAVLGFSSTLLMLLLASVVTFLSLLLLKKVFEASRRDFFLSCSFLCFLSAASAAASHSVVAAMYTGTAWSCSSCWPRTRVEVELAEAIFLFIHSLSLLLAYLNMGLMWIEFMICSQCAQNVGSNLRRTANILYAVGGLWSIASTALICAHFLVDHIFGSVWALSNLPFGAMLTVVYVVGGRAMRGIFLRAGERSSQQAALLALDSPSLSAAQSQKAKRMRLRASNTRFAYFIAACLAPLYLLLALAAEVLIVLRIDASFVRVVHTLLRCTLYCQLASMIGWLYSSLKVEQSAASFNSTLATASNVGHDVGLSHVKQEHLSARPFEPANQPLSFPTQLEANSQSACSSSCTSASGQREAVELPPSVCTSSARAATDVHACMARGEMMASELAPRVENDARLDKLCA